MADNGLFPSITFHTALYPAHGAPSLITDYRSLITVYRLPSTSTTHYQPIAELFYRPEIIT